MTPSSIASARERVAQAREALLEPDLDLPGQILALEQAVAVLRGIEGDVPSDDELRELGALREEVQRVRTLVQHGEEFWTGWARLLGLDTGYTASGAPAAVAGTGSRLTVQG